VTITQTSVAMATTISMAPCLASGFTKETRPRQNRFIDGFVLDQDDKSVEDSLSNFAASNRKALIWHSVAYLKHLFELNHN